MVLFSQHRGHAHDATHWTVVSLPLAELVDLCGRGEATERVKGRAEAEQEVGVIGAGRRGGAQREGGAVGPRGLCVLPRLPRDVPLLRQNPHTQQHGGPGR